MKTYDVRYELFQEVYVLLHKEILKTRVEKIRITQGQPYIRGEDMKEMDGIEIDYLLVVNEKIYRCGSHSCGFEWFNQDNVFLTKEELINKIF